MTQNSGSQNGPTYSLTGFSLNVRNFIATNREAELSPKAVHSSLKFVTLVRCVYALLVLLYSTLWIYPVWNGSDDPMSSLFLGCVIEVFAFTAISCVALLRNVLIRTVSYVGMFHDAALAAFFVMFTGYYASPFLYLFLIIPLYGGISLQKNGGLVGAVIVSVVLTCLYFFASGLIYLAPSAIRIAFSSMVTPTHEVASRFISLGLACFGVGILTGQLAWFYHKAQINLFTNDREFAHLRGVYEHLLNAIPVGVIIVNPESGTRLYSNPAAKKLIIDAGEPDEIEKILTPPSEIIRDGAEDLTWISPFHEQFLRISKFEVSILPQKVLAGYYLSDVTHQEKKQIEQNRRQRLEVLGQVSAKIAHEIRNPLTCISGCNEMLQSEIEDEELSQMTEMMGHEIDRLNNLLNDILVFSRCPKLSMSKFQVARTLELQRDIFLSDSTNQALMIELDVPNEMTLVTDENAFCQIVMTLWRNSSEAIKGAGKIMVWNEPELNALCFSDSGGGLSDDIADKVFEPFYTTKPSGTGLGLSTARQLAVDCNMMLSWDKTLKCFVLNLTENKENPLAIE